MVLAGQSRHCFNQRRKFQPRATFCICVAHRTVFKQWACGAIFDRGVDLWLPNPACVSQHLPLPTFPFLVLRMWSPVSSEQWTRLHSQLVKGDSEAQPVNSELIPIRSHFGTGLPALQLSVALWCDVPTPSFKRLRARSVARSSLSCLGQCLLMPSMFP